MDRILVVDDNLANVRQISTLLSGNYTVLAAKSGEQALQIAARQIPDLILLDIDMPGMNGFETMRRFRANVRLSGIPIIVLTANNDPESEIHGLRAGAKDFISKPFSRSVLLHRIGLHLRISSYQQQMRHTVQELENTIGVNFAALIERRDKNTGGHVRRTCRYFEILGKALIHKGLFRTELDEPTLEMMMRGAPLHDIGKIGISDATLLKPGKLTEEEFTAIKKHPAIGGTLLGNMYRRIPTQQYLRYAKRIAESHHERYDGSGYPYGLAGEAIPLCARIMAVVDVYDALVSDRVYRNAMSHEEGCSIITQGQGQPFDPYIVAVFQEIHEQFRACAAGDPTAEEGE